MLCFFALLYPVGAGWLLVNAFGSLASLCFLFLCMHNVWAKHALCLPPCCCFSVDTIGTNAHPLPCLNQPEITRESPKSTQNSQNQEQNKQKGEASHPSLRTPPISLNQSGRETERALSTLVPDKAQSSPRTNTNTNTNSHTHTHTLLEEAEEKDEWGQWPQCSRGCLFLIQLVGGSRKALFRPRGERERERSRERDTHTHTYTHSYTHSYTHTHNPLTHTLVAPLGLGTHWTVIDCIEPTTRPQAPLPFYQSSHNQSVSTRPIVTSSIRTHPLCPLAPSHKAQTHRHRHTQMPTNPSQTPNLLVLVIDDQGAVTFYNGKELKIYPP